MKAGLKTRKVIRNFLIFFLIIIFLLIFRIGWIQFINGEELQENYLQPDVVTESKILNDFIVPEGYLFCMGDNRTKSTDCRNFGCIPLDKIEGIVVFRFWPFSVFGKVK